MTREKMKKEAVKRMKMLRILPQTIKEFETDDVVNESEGIGALYWLNEDEEELVKEFEKEFGVVVYHVIHSFTEFGELYAFLYVSQYEEEWEYDNESLQEGFPLAYVVNKSHPDCSEFGSIGVRPSIGGLVRTF